MHHIHPYRWFAVTAVIAGGLAIPAYADRDELPMLRATAQLPGVAKNQATTFSLEGLDPTRYRILARSSKQSVVLGYPARNPCARTKVTLRLKPVDADPLAYVRDVMPIADGEGQETRATGPDFSSGLERVRAWRVNGDIQDSRKLVLRGVVARKLTKAGKPAIQELTFKGETTRPQVDCATGNRFTIGPGFMDLLRMGGE